MTVKVTPTYITLMIDLDLQTSQKVRNLISTIKPKFHSSFLIEFRSQVVNHSKHQCNQLIWDHSIEIRRQKKKKKTNANIDFEI